MKKIKFRVLLLMLAVFAVGSQAWADVALTTAFDNSIFRGYISYKFDTNKDGSLSDEEISKAVSIDLSVWPNVEAINTLQGIEYLTSLRELKTGRTNLAKADLSKNTELMSLDIDANIYNSIALDISNTSIISLDIGADQPTITAKNCKTLRYVCLRTYCYGLDVEGCTALKTITTRYINNSGRENYGALYYSLNVTGCTALETVDITYGWYIGSPSYGEAPDFSDCTNLKTLILGRKNSDGTGDGFLYSGVTFLDLTNCSELEKLFVSYNTLAALRLSSSLSGTPDLEFKTQKERSVNVLNTTADGFICYYDFNQIIPDYTDGIIESSIRAYDILANQIPYQYDSDTGQLYLAFKPNRIYYEYNVGYGSQVLPVNLRVSGTSNLYKPSISTYSLPAGLAGLAYEASLSASGTTPITWDIISGDLPLGITMTTGGKLTGTPAEAGTYTATFRAKNIGGEASKDLKIIIGTSAFLSAPTITTTSLPDGTVDAGYNTSLKASGSGPITWELSDGTLPPGLTLSTNGTIAGTPTTAGSYDITVMASNTAGETSADFTISITKSAYDTTTSGDTPTTLPVYLRVKPTITTTVTSPMTVGGPYTLQLTAKGTTPIVWSITKGKMPAGLTFTNTGLITGTPTKAKTTKITVTASNDYGKDTRVVALESYIFPEITTDSLKRATVGKKYSAKFKSKGTKPLKWSVEGSLPQGLTFDANKGKITGTPTYNTSGNFVIALSNPVGSVSKMFSINVEAIVPEIKTKKLSDATYGKSYKAEFKVKGTEPMTFELDGELPAGLSFDETKGIIYGTPTEDCSNRELTLTVSNMGGETEKAFSLTVKAVAPKITTKKLPDAMMYKNYETQIAAEGSGEMTWTVEGLPDGMYFDDGLLTGAPLVSGKFKLNVTVTNSLKTAKKKYTLKIESPLMFTEDGATLDEGMTLPDGVVGKSYKYAFSVGGATPITFSITDGALPNGITLDSRKGTLKGKPTESGTFKFTLKIQNSSGTAEQDFQLSINAEAPSLSGSLAVGTVGSYYSSGLTVKGTAPFEWEMTDTLPAGLTFSEGTISGTPTEAWDGLITITATNSGGHDTKVVRLRIKGNSSSNGALPENNGTLDGGEYVIAAELPAVSADEDGMREFDVELDERAEAGAKLVWLARPAEGEESDDDTIAEFYDESGAEIDSVPEGRKITVSAWLRKGVTYRPAIAVKIEN